MFAGSHAGFPQLFRILLRFFIQFLKCITDLSIHLLEFLIQFLDQMGKGSRKGVKSTLSSCSFVLSSIQIVTGFFILDHLTFFTLYRDVRAQ